MITNSISIAPLFTMFICTFTEVAVLQKDLVVAL